MALSLHETTAGIVFKVKVVPGSSRDRIAGLLGDALKIAVAAAPERGAANQAVVKLLARQLGLPANQIEVIRGHTHPRKEIRVRGITATELLARLEPAG